MIIRCKINVTKIEKAKLFHGEQGVYLDFTLLENKNGVDQYGNHFMIIQDASKEERKAGVKGAILGNAKKLEPRGQPAQRQAGKPAPVAGDGPADDDSVPF